MAIVSDGFYISWTVADNNANVTTRTFKMQGATQEDAETDAPGVITALMATTDAVLVSWHFYEEHINDALTYPAAGVENQNQALMSFLLTGGVKKATLTIPAPKITLFAAATGPDAQRIDPADAAVIAYVGLFEADGQLYLSDGETAASFLKGKRRHIKAGNG